MHAVVTERSAAFLSRLSVWLVLLLRAMASFACFAFAGCFRASGARAMSRLLADFTPCYSGDLPSSLGRMVSGGVWPLLCAGPGP